MNAVAILLVTAFFMSKKVDSSMETITKKQVTEEEIKKLQDYLKNPDNTSGMYVNYQGRKRRLFYSSEQEVFGIIDVGKKRAGKIFYGWSFITKIHYPKVKTEDDIQKQKQRITKKYKKLAAEASFTNPFIRNCLEADLSKDVYENNLTTGTRIDGKIISLEAIRKTNSWEYQSFLNALKNKWSYNSGRFPFRGYEATLEVRPYKQDDTYLQPGDIIGYLSVEYKGCGNGYYYLLINDEKFIGVDID